MRVDRPLIGAVLFLGAGLGLILRYCQGATGFNVAYPFAGSTLHFDLTTTGPAVVGGVLCTAIGVVLLVWAFLAALVSLFAFTERTRERIFERYSIMPSADAPGDSEDVVVEEEEEEDKPHFWSRTARHRI
ncbi:MAG TPA: hypothetical protein VHD85_07445 [Terracidiphilus sp.]|jgi:hypothetical protein|nr:hypothetical protein [Terracidiphilus sp.]